MNNKRQLSADEFAAMRKCCEAVGQLIVNPFTALRGADERSLDTVMGFGMFSLFCGKAVQAGRLEFRSYADLISMVGNVTSEGKEKLVATFLEYADTVFRERQQIEPDTIEPDTAEVKPK